MIEAIAEVMREPDIVVLNTYRGLDKTTGQPAEAASHGRDARITVEWIRRTGRFGLDVELWGAGVRTDVSQAELARQFARALDAPILMSDCSHFGFSWLKHDADGSIWEVVSNTQDIDDFDLLCDLDPGHPDFYPARLIWRADEPLPAAGHPVALPAPSWRACEGEAANSNKLCRHFRTPYCPKFAKASEQGPCVP